MVLFNYSTKELTAKIVYYGPGLCGKTTNLQYIHENLSDTVRGKMLSLATKTDRTLFFDFLPMDLGEIRGMKTRMQLYTVPGQVFYNETRKLVLKGVDGIVFVADSQQEMLNPNIESFKNLEENLKTHGLSLEQIPHVIQFNKRDLPKLASVEEINAALNKYNAPFYESVATTGIGVQDTLKAITKLVLLNLTKKYEPRTAATQTATAAEPAPPVAPTPEPARMPVASIPVSEPVPEAVPLAASAPEAAAAPEPIPAPSPPAAPMASVAPAEPTPPPPAAIAGAAFGGDEMVDDLLSEVQGSTDTAPTIQAEVDLTDHLIDDARAPVDEEAFGDPLVKLTEVVEDHELFDDPNLDVARLDPGQCREIVVPVMIGRQGEVVRKFKLSLKLQLDPLD